MFYELLNLKCFLKILLFFSLIFNSQVLCIKKFQRPEPVNGTTLVVVTSLTLFDLNSIRVVDMDYRLDYYLVHEWNVSRATCEEYVKQLKQDDLFYNSTRPIVFSGNMAKYFWVPDTYVEEARQIEVPTLPGNNQYLTFFVSDTDEMCSLKFEVRLAAIVGCQMDFHGYPYDRQLCYFRLRSRMYLIYTGALTLKYYLKHLLSKCSDFNPLPSVQFVWNASDITFETDMDLNDYDIGYSWNQYNESLKGVRFAWLEVDFVFQRRLSQFMVGAVIPTIIIVMVAYSSFWIGVDTGPARFILTVTTFLTLTTQFAGLKNQLPPVSYMTGLDVWMLGCMIFVFVAIIELAVVNYLDKKRRTNIEKRKQEYEERRRLMKLMKNDTTKRTHPFPTTIDYLHAKGHKEVKFGDTHSLEPIPTDIFHLELNAIISEPDQGIKVDWVLRVVYPISFILFNIVYWPLLLTRSLV